MKLVKPAGQDYRLDAGIVRKTLVLGVTSFLSQICFIFLQAMGKALESSMPVSDLLTFIVALYLIRQTYKELGKEKSVE